MDTELKILSELDDRSLLNYCLVNKKTSQVCRNEGFWRRRYINKWGENAARYKPVERSWKNHYLQTLIDLDRFKDRPEVFLKYIYWGKADKDKLFIPDIFNPNSKVSFFNAPEWVMTNFYLLDLGRAYVDGEFKDHVTPAMLFESEVKHVAEGMGLNGFGYAAYPFWRDVH